MRDFVKDIQISEPIPHAQPMVGLELASVARAADALKISRRSGLPAFNRRMSLAGTMWSTCRLIPTCLKSTLHVSTSHFPRRAGVRRLPHPFRHGRRPGHFLSTRLQRTGLSWALKRDPQWRHRRWRYELWPRYTVLSTSARLSPQYGQRMFSRFLPWDHET
jgi:hypothetical protein